MLTKEAWPSSRRLGRGSVIGGLLIQNELNGDGAAERYRATRLSSRRDVVVEVLSPRLSGESALAQEVFDRIRTLMKARCANVVGVEELVAKPFPYVVTEFARGLSVRELIERAIHRRRAIPCSIALRIGADAAVGLGELHGIGVVHGKVGAASIIVGSDGIARIADFGAVVPAALTRTAKTARAALGRFSTHDGAFRVDDIRSVARIICRLVGIRAPSDGRGSMDGDADGPGLCQPERVPALVTGLLDAALSGRVGSAAEFAEGLEKAARRAGLLATARDVCKYIAPYLGLKEALQPTLLHLPARDETSSCSRDGAGGVRRTLIASAFALSGNITQRARGLRPTDARIGGWIAAAVVVAALPLLAERWVHKVLAGHDEAQLPSMARGLPTKTSGSRQPVTNVGAPPASSPEARLAPPAAADAGVGSDLPSIESSPVPPPFAAQPKQPAPSRAVAGIKRSRPMKAPESEPKAASSESLLDDVRSERRARRRALIGSEIVDPWAL